MDALQLDQQLIDIIAAIEAAADDALELRPVAQARQLHTNLMQAAAKLTAVTNTIWAENAPEDIFQ